MVKLVPGVGIHFVCATPLPVLQDRVHLTHRSGKDWPNGHDQFPRCM